MSVEPDLPRALLEVAQLAGYLAHAGERPVAGGSTWASLAHDVSPPSSAPLKAPSPPVRRAPARIPFTRPAASSVE